MHFLILSIILNCLSVILLKVGADSIINFTFFSIIQNVFYISSIFSLGLQAILWQLALKKYDLNYAYLFTSLYYPIILSTSYIIFREQLSTNNLIGTLIIIIGLLISQKK